MAILARGGPAFICDGVGVQTLGRERSVRLQRTRGFGSCSLRADNAERERIQRASNVHQTRCSTTLSRLRLRLSHH